MTLDGSDEEVEDAEVVSVGMRSNHWVDPRSATEDKACVLNAREGVEEEAVDIVARTPC